MDSKDKEIIKDFLIKNNPILFLGAGFSYGAENRYGQTLPTGKELKNSIFNKFIQGKVSAEEIEYLQDANLRKVCEFVKIDLDQGEQLCEFIIDSLRGVKTRDFDYNLLKFPWKKIYTINIDDLVEHIYENGKRKLIVQNTSKKQECALDEVQLIKLHGCVNKTKEEIVFSETDYQDLIDGALQYRLNDLMRDIENESFIFVGTNLDEPDIQHYIKKYERAGYDMWHGKILFIEPYPSFELKRKIKQIHGELVEGKTEDFLKYLGELNYQPDKLEKAKIRLSYEGIHSYKRLIDAQEEGNYESRLYHGMECNWRDLKERWMFESPEFENILKKISEIDMSDTGCFTFAICGKRFSGKACLLKLLGAQLDNMGYEIFVFEGRMFKLKALFQYIKMSPQKNFALLIDNASFYYQNIEKCYREDLGEKKLLFLTTSRLYYHEKKKYYLDDNPYYEYNVESVLTEKYAGIIYDKLEEKGSIGYLSRNRDEAIRQIIKEKSLINFLSKLTLGENFRQRIIEDVNIIMAEGSLRKFFLECAIFDRADIPYYPKQLMNGRFNFLSKMRKGTRDNNDYNFVVTDYVSIKKQGLSIKNSILLDEVFKKTDREEKIKAIEDILKYISKYVNEKENSYWRIVFESLAKGLWLEKNMKFSRSEIMKFYYQLKSYYKDVSYYWLQLGIAEQRQKDFAKAQIHLKMAEEIRPMSYQIQHALARNYLKHSIYERQRNEAENLFKQGASQMVALIESKEKYKEKARDFSIHCYVSEWINYCSKVEMGAKVSSKDINKIYKYIEMMKHKDTKYYADIAQKFVKFLKKINKTSNISFEPDSIYLGLLASNKNDEIEVDVDDYY